MEEKRVLVRISNGKNNIYNYRYDLYSNGFEFNKRSGNNSFYEQMMSETSSKAWESFCRQNKLTCNVIPEQYTRSADYRKEYFKQAVPAVEAKYRCAYCGKKLVYRDVTVDHIIPVNKMSYNKSARIIASRLGIENVNDPKNLVSACRKCNSKKGTKMGAWLWKGFFGKSEALWKIRMGFRWAFAAVIAVAICCSVLAATDFVQTIAAKIAF